MGFFRNMFDSLAASDGMPARQAFLGTGGRSYDAARHDTPETAGWNTNRLETDSEMLGAKGEIASRARDLDRNDGFIYGGVDRRVEAVVGAKIRLEARPAYDVMGRSADWADDWATATEAQFRVWANDPRCLCDAERVSQFGGLVRIAYYDYMLDGEACAEILDLNRGGAFTTAVKLIDPERLSNPRNLPDNHILPNGNKLIGGVEINRDGAPIAYHIRKAHSADTTANMDKFTWVRVPREGRTGRPRFVRAYSKRRSQQHHAVSRLAAAMIPAKMLHRTDRATVEATLLQTVLAAFVESGATSEDLRDALAPTGDTADSDYAENLVKYRQENKIRLSGAQIIHGAPGEKFELTSPQHNHDNYETFQALTLRKMSSAFGLSYPQLSQNWADINYSSARTLLNEIWRGFLDDRHLFTQSFCSPIYAAWLEEAISIGRVKVPGGPRMFYKWRTELSLCEWMGPGRGTVDPKKEEDAASEANAAGRLSHQTRAGELGLDHRDELIKQQRERKMRERLDLPEPVYGGSGSTPAVSVGEPNSDAADIADQRETAGEDA